MPLFSQCASLAERKTIVLLRWGKEGPCTRLRLESSLWFFVWGGGTHKFSGFNALTGLTGYFRSDQLRFTIRWTLSFQSYRHRWAFLRILYQWCAQVVTLDQLVTWSCVYFIALTLCYNFLLLLFWNTKWQIMTTNSSCQIVTWTCVFFFPCHFIIFLWHYFF